MQGHIQTAAALHCCQTVRNDENTHDQVKSSFYQNCIANLSGYSWANRLSKQISQKICFAVGP